jgi:Leucine-rich repeat (LRR) protein
VRRNLSVIKTCSKISMLDLSRNNMFNSSPHDHVGRSWVNKTFRSLPSLSRLDLSYNLLTDRVGQVLQGLSLSYLNLTASHLSPGDLQHLVSLNTLVHLDLSQNNIGDAFSHLVFKSNMLVNLEILELEDCFLSPSNFTFVLPFIKSCPNLKILNLSYNTLEVSQILQLIQLRLEVLLVFSKIVCSCTTSKCTCYEVWQLFVSHTLASEGYDLRSFDKEAACHAIETFSKFIVFKAFLSPEL